ncbi:MAG: hypothetical protein BWY76_03329 [bacterium ADurb.Bin429]|nr:MAG: hypothetical protein BWY76_03329 [bacterium ADurb.Bin429]
MRISSWGCSFAMPGMTASTAASSTPRPMTRLNTAFGSFARRMTICWPMPVSPTCAKRASLSSWSPPMITRIISASGRATNPFPGAMCPRCPRRTARRYRRTSPSPRMNPSPSASFNTVTRRRIPWPTPRRTNGGNTATRIFAWSSRRTGGSGASLMRCARMGWTTIPSSCSPATTAMDTARTDGTRRASCTKKLCASRC